MNLSLRSFAISIPIQPLGPFIERNAAARPDRDAGTALLADRGFTAVAADELLQSLLTTALVADIELERVLTGLRAALLVTVRDPAGHADPETGIAFFSALARQCFIYDYVYAQADWEREQVEALCGSLAPCAPARRLRHRRSWRSLAICRFLRCRPQIYSWNGRGPRR